MARGPASSATATATMSEDVAGSSSKRAFLYLLLECRRPWAGGARFALGSTEEVRIGRGGERRSERASGGALSIEIPDSRLSTKHARFARLARGWAFEDLDSKNGSRVRGDAVKRTQLNDGDVIEIGETLLLFKEEEADGDDRAEPEAVAPGLATLSPVIAEHHRRLAAVAASEVPVLIVGETGTGKELAARGLHALSRRDGRFVAVNCGALATSIIEAELFGHRQGAFSGANEARPGLIRAAHKGTLLLDEIGELPAQTQAALLRVLQEKEVLPVGETNPVKVDVRVVAATHRDLRSLAEEGRFRLDLLARLEGYAAELTPVRERRCDLGVLIAALLERMAPDRAKQLSFHPQAARAIIAHDWPRNVRELELALASAVALTKDGVITVGHLPDTLRDAPATVSFPPPAPSSKTPAPLSAEDAALKERVEALLDEHKGSINGVARAMGKDRTQIRRWLARFQIDPDKWRA